MKNRLQLSGWGLEKGAELLHGAGVGNGGSGRGLENSLRLSGWGLRHEGGACGGRGRGLLF